MRAARFHEYGPADVLVIDDIPEPHAGPGEIRVRVAAVSVNAVDWMYRAGMLRDYIPDNLLPATPGCDAAGTVDEVGEGVTGVSVGDAVFGLAMTFGASAEHVVLTAWAPVPATWSPEQAAGAGLAVATAVSGLNTLGDLSGKTLLVEGAAGGVGSAAVAIAAARGATVIGTASEAKHEYLRGIGALPTTYGPGLADRVAALAPGGVDVVLDAAGSGSVTDLLAIAGEESRLAVVANIQLTTSLGLRYISAENDSAHLAEGATHGANGHYTPHIAETFPLDKIAEAHRYAERRRTQGKIVVTL
ncbi:NADP-dependent oxidoreductase [Streptomyces luteogriseus]|uniref:NADP-dependent oxidoreductase n=1 Tax=Streptomyces luteogriseus TaxID=68233 RepID=UPI0037FAEC90